MAQEINIAKILQSKPNGTKLYSSIFGECKVYAITESSWGVKINVELNTRGKYRDYYKEDGKYSPTGECCLFPSKEMRDWSKFAWEKGDVLVNEDLTITVIFDGFATDDYTQINTIYSYEGNNQWYKENIYSTASFTKMSEEDSSKFITLLEDKYKGKFNAETLEVEEANPKYEFKPLDYVLSNDNEDKEWCLCQFSHFDKEGNIVFVGGSFVDKKCVIPYEGNEDLLGTTKSLED